MFFIKIDLNKTVIFIQKMNTYSDIYVGFIKEENIKSLKQRKIYDSLNIIKLGTFFKEHCLVQYNLENKGVLCSFCQEVLPDNLLIYYDEQKRYIFPEYLYHYIRYHNIEIDQKLIELSNFISDW